MAASPLGCVTLLNNYAVPFMYRNRPCNLKISRAPLKVSKAKHRVLAYSRALRRIKGVVQGKLRSYFQRVRGDRVLRVAVKVGVVYSESGRMNDRMSRGKSFRRDDILVLSGEPRG